ncbi:MAG TPA: thiamine pyrophosphate-binding protein, partial [Gemmatimonadales bacterium]|nr:thiamine pyrophosphate-binding protein [Gemmatimonadales bacterium]
MTGSAFFADMLQAYEVSHLFFVPTVMYPTLRELDARGIRSVMTHGEKAASYMADGYARALRKPGFCMAQNVGGANLAAGVKDAYLACSPVVAITGGPFAEYRYRHEYQEVEHFRMFDPVTKLNAVVDRIDRLPDLMRQAFRAATTGTPRPVHLEMRGHMGNVVEEEGDLELVVEAPFKGYPAFRPEAEQALVRQAARRLAQAERPMIVAGGGVTASDAGPELLALADRLGIPVATSLNAKELIPGDHPLNVGVVGTYSRWCANRLVSEADLVFFVGSHAGSQVTHHWQYPPVGTPAIQLDIDPLEIGRNYPIEIGLQGDAKATLRRLLDVAETPRARTAWHERVR